MCDIRHGLWRRKEGGEGRRQRGRSGIDTPPVLQDASYPQRLYRPTSCSVLARGSACLHRLDCRDHGPFGRALTAADATDACCRPTSHSPTLEGSPCTRGALEPVAAIPVPQRGTQQVLWTLACSAPPPPSGAYRQQRPSTLHLSAPRGRPQRQAAPCIECLSYCGSQAACAFARCLSRVGRVRGGGIAHRRCLA